MTPPEQEIDRLQKEAERLKNDIAYLQREEQGARESEARLQKEVELLKASRKTLCEGFESAGDILLIACNEVIRLRKVLEAIVSQVEGEISKGREWCADCLTLARDGLAWGNKNESGETKVGPS